MPEKEMEDPTIIDVPIDDDPSDPTGGTGDTGDSDTGGGGGDAGGDTAGDWIEITTETAVFAGNANEYTATREDFGEGDVLILTHAEHGSYLVSRITSSLQFDDSTHSFSDVVFAVFRGKWDSSAYGTGPSNTAPVVGPVTLNKIGEGETYTIRESDILAFATDAEGDALTVSSLSIASGGGELTDNGDGTWFYTPAQGDESEVTFAFVVSDGAFDVADTVSVDIAPALDLTLTGTSGSDTLTGGAGDDTISASAGDDVVEGGAGNDVLQGHKGQDILNGGTGDDVITGGNGWDTINGGAGDDVINGGNGQDTAVWDGDYADFTFALTTVNGSTTLTVTDQNAADGLDEGQDTVSDTTETLQFADGSHSFWDIVADLTPGLVLDGNDNANSLAGGDGHDVIYGHAGHDTLQGGNGDDHLLGQKNNDYLDGGAGDDILNGGQHADTLVGGSGDDILKGGKGPDMLIGGSGDDMLTGGLGTDTFVFADADGAQADTIADFNELEGDLIDLSSVGSVSSLSDLSISDVNGDAVIAWDSSTVTLTGISSSTLDGSEFIFVA